MNRVDPTTAGQEKTQPKLEPPTMTSTHARELQQQTQLEAGHETITEGIVAAVNQETNTEIEEDTPTLQEKLTESLGAHFHCSCNPKRREPVVKFCIRMPFNFFFLVSIQN